ncbi:transposase [Candidatus Bathyarchaeota archaeon]|nr:transposase [Candidatus Bathyarchaeota archaeon]
MNNNRIECLHGTLSDLRRTMRAFKNPDCVIIEGQRIYYNHIRPHTALNGKTPAEVFGIKIEGKNKWLTLIQNAAKS